MHSEVNTSTIFGSVVDESGSGEPNSKVVTAIIATGQQRNAMTDGVGELVIRNCPLRLQKYSGRSAFYHEWSSDMALRFSCDRTPI